jgi:KaiC/GvpD/RAD55 family RecA-like ATPase
MDRVGWRLSLPSTAVPAIDIDHSMPHLDTELSRDPFARLVPGRAHILFGGPGAGKTALCLRFIGAGLIAGERTAMLVAGRVPDIKAHAKTLGFDLDDALRLGRLTMLRYRTELAERLAQTASPRDVIAAVERSFGPTRPSRIVIDSFAPLLADGATGAAIIEGLSTYLERSGATSLLTYPEDLSAGYDRRLEPLIQSAAAVLRLERRARDRVDLEALTTRAIVEREPIAKQVGLAS